MTSAARQPTSITTTPASPWCCACRRCVVVLVACIFLRGLVMVFNVGQNNSTGLDAHMLCFRLAVGIAPEAPSAVGAAAAPASNLLSGNTTNATMAVLPPFMPMCSVMHVLRVKVQCPVINCSLDVSCTTQNTSCCAYINLQMMLFFDQFLSSQGLEGQYMLVYGSALGAVRNRTVLPHTADVDFGLSPRAVQVLERNGTRAELWRHGYAFWADLTVWRMCPHQHHPSAAFRRLMLPLHAMNHLQQYNLTGAYAGMCWLDGFLIWPVPPQTKNCSHEDPALDMDYVLGPVPTASLHRLDASHKVGGFRSAGGPLRAATVKGTNGSADVLGAQTFCLHRGTAPVILKRGSRPAVVDGFRLPAPEDVVGHVAATYGPKWRQPDLKYHGADPDTPDVDKVRDSLRERLSVTAWGNMPWEERHQRCRHQHVEHHARVPS